MKRKLNQTLDTKNVGFGFGLLANYLQILNKAHLKFKKFNFENHLF